MRVWSVAAFVLVAAPSLAVAQDDVIRYCRVFGDSRFKSMVPVSLRWSF